MIDESDELFIKPSTQKELDFYSQVQSRDSALIEVIPVFLGDLQLNDGQSITGVRPISGEEEASPAIPADSSTGSTSVQQISAPAGSHGDIHTHLITLAQSQHDPNVHGKAIKAHKYLVLENLTGGFARPNVMDIKLGSRLWADDAPQEKRDRLDKVSQSTTSAELNLRVAGIRLYLGEDPAAFINTVDPFPWRTEAGLQGRSIPEADMGKEFTEAAAKYGYLYDDKISKPDSKNASDDAVLLSFEPAPDNVLVHTKHYGRSMRSWDVRFVLERFTFVKSAHATWENAAMMLKYFVTECKKIKAALEESETRMYSPSILFLYEGDGTVFDQKLKFNASLPPPQLDEADVSSDDDSDGQPTPEKLFELKLIDFAHASFTPGQGPDRNVIDGVDSLIKELEYVLNDADKRAHDGSVTAQTS
jgi:inositol-polyphosphate multikinase